ncbi:uncharacterized protein LACBIDRAFT_329794 [Laccaria bicolor S238N-H82]|uniref:Predicted protein n=1 Tax=Laccaria bicolor (strain S238N-H82 / ATCC MYA-4686) TaxID=486041 RepID=B0DJ93_LACBS|nr:uncharacterized protein LACBIDRAFT_329794 [Laccaria bicolor S238N-H82]EDR05483.1 predicted protein [Laccaria bicolor S238N-H82]|eukprot:XP_001884041.1 predicted protein [Laccaria bicolor S238N-H82]
MKEGIAQLAPFKWTSCTLSWWETLPTPDRTYFSSNWDNIMIGIQAHFLDEEWVRDRTFEFDEMTFCNKGHEQESPLDETICPSILSVQSIAKQMRNSLITSWQQAERNKKPALYYRNHRSRVAHAAEVDLNNQGMQLESYSSDEEEEWDVNYASNNSSEEEEADREYLVMLAESKITLSAYKSENLFKSFATEIHSSQGQLRNSFAAEKHVKIAAVTCDEIDKVEPCVEATFHKVYSAHRNAQKSKDYNKGKNKEVVPVNEIIRFMKVKKVEPIYEPGCVFPMVKGQSLPEGMGSSGTKALHMCAKIGNLKSDSIRARLDSGADITLISEEFWKSMSDSPRLCEGMRMKLYHLTGGAKVLGYINTELYVLA